jgi:hypothetical protein
LPQALLDHVLPLTLRDIFEYGERNDRPLYVGHTDSMMLHLGYCNHLPAAADRSEFTDMDVAEAAGYRTCPACFPADRYLPIDGYGRAREGAVEQARLFEIAFPVVDDAEARADLQELGPKVVENMPFDTAGFEYTFKIVHSELIQTVAMPTGFIHVTDPLMDLVEDEKEIAFVLAHEVTHGEINLPPIGDSNRSPFMTALEWQGWRDQMRYREQVSDLIALQGPQNAYGAVDVHDHAFSILCKLQFAHETKPAPEPDPFSTHSSYQLRIDMLAPDRFEPAGTVRSSSGRDKNAEGVVRITVMGKGNDPDETFTYLLAIESDSIKPWGPARSWSCA